MCLSCQRERETRTPTDNPNITLVMREKNNAFEFLRETYSTTGEEPNPADASETIETIRIVRKSLNTIS